MGIAGHDLRFAVRTIAIPGVTIFSTCQIDVYMPALQT